MTSKWRKGLLIVIISVALVATAGTFTVSAQEEEPEKTPPMGQKMADLVVVRPLSAAGTVVGTGLFFVMLPVSLMTGNVTNMFRDTIVRPAKYTFTRSLGEMEEEGR